MQHQISSHGGMTDNMILGLIIAIGFGTIEDIVIRLFVICSTAFIAGILSKTGQQVQPIIGNYFKNLYSKVKKKLWKK